MSIRFGFEHSYAEQLEGTYVLVNPAGFPDPKLRFFNAPLAAELGLPATVQTNAAQVLSGTTMPADARPLAQAYAGHQFGGFSPQLGDGRALLLGEIVDVNGRRRDIQLKGSGRTPFSRRGDGKAVLGPILREALIAEAMHALGVPTTRVLAAIETGERVYREGQQPGAVLARVAASHLRVGTLEFLAAKGETETLARVVNYTLERHFPEYVGDEWPARALLERVALVQANLIAKWMHLGFVHGVMNTDNFTLSGETIDYGPCAFMDHYDPATCFSSIDRNGRYAYANQPLIGQWNLARMAEALLPLLADKKKDAIAVAQGSLDRYMVIYNEVYAAGMSDKLGLQDSTDDESLVEDLLSWMHTHQRDFTSTFRQLATGAEVADPTWHHRWRAAHGQEPFAAIAERMNQVNPIYVPRNHLVEAALSAANTGDMGPFDRLYTVLQTPFTAQEGLERYAEPAPADFGDYQTFCGT